MIVKIYYFNHKRDTQLIPSSSQHMKTLTRTLITLSQFATTHLRCPPWWFPPKCLLKHKTMFQLTFMLYCFQGCIIEPNAQVRAADRDGAAVPLLAGDQDYPL